MRKTDSRTLEMKDRIKHYLLRPDTVQLSKGQQDRIDQGFESHDSALTSKEALLILEDIRKVDRDLGAALKEYTPHEICQVSLVREVLMDSWNAKKRLAAPAGNTRSLREEAMA